MFRLTAPTRAILVAAACSALAVPGTASSRRLPAKSGPSKAPPEAAGSRYAGETISLDLKDADLKDVLRTFAKLARLNIAIDPEVKGSVTVRLHDVPWDQALDVILRINGLGYVLEGNVLRVGEPRKLIPVCLPD
jgi:type II secretory pathway component HofQ